jgi:hypothetical protein
MLVKMPASEKVLDSFITKDKNVSMIIKPKIILININNTVTPNILK